MIELLSLPERGIAFAGAALPRSLGSEAGQPVRFDYEIDLERLPAWAFFVEDGAGNSRTFFEMDELEEWCEGRRGLVLRPLRVRWVGVLQ